MGFDTYCCKFGVFHHHHLNQIVSIIAGSGERQQIAIESFDLGSESLDLGSESPDTIGE